MKIALLGACYKIQFVAMQFACFLGSNELEEGDYDSATT